jgi:pimeloyl-ACP methyl ester carboxylesterase
MDEAGFETAHLVGNSLGGYLALELAARGRARTVVALAPAGGWGPDDRTHLDTFAEQEALVESVRTTGPYAQAALATKEGRRRATRLVTVDYEHIPEDLLVHQLLGAARVQGPELLAHARQAAWTLDAESITCPVRIVWGTADRLLPWPDAAKRYRESWLPHADWVVLDDVGHAPQLDVPLETAELILGFTRA